MSVETGDITAIEGLLRYSPSGRRVLFIDRFYENLRNITIWRFEKDRLVEEFRYVSSKSTDVLSVGHSIWKNENEIVLFVYENTSEIGRLVREKDSWTIRSPYPTE